MLSVGSPGEEEVKGQAQEHPPHCDHHPRVEVVGGAVVVAVVLTEDDSIEGDERQKQRCNKPRCIQFRCGTRTPYLKEKTCYRKITLQSARPAVKVAVMLLCMYGPRLRSSLYVCNLSSPACLSYVGGAVLHFSLMSEQSSRSLSVSVWK